MKLKTGILLLLIATCGIMSVTTTNNTIVANKEFLVDKTQLIILGTVQDAGSPHIACKKDCCKELFLHPDVGRKVVSLGLIDNENQKNYIIEATPDLAIQMKNLQQHSPFSTKETPDGILLTHAHIGHYSGLMYLGKEAMNADKLDVYAMPRMKQFLETNGPWSQLVNNKNILSKEGVLQWVEASTLEVLITAGAGDIDTLIEPIIKRLS